MDRLTSMSIFVKAVDLGSFSAAADALRMSPQLVGKHTESNVNNPSENLEVWRAGQVRALCVFDKERIAYKTKVTETQSWNDIPTWNRGWRAVERSGLRISTRRSKGMSAWA